MLTDQAPEAAEATLTLVTDDPEASRRLLDAGIASIGAVARAPLPTLAAQLPDLEHEQLVALKRRALAASAEIRNQIAAQAAQVASTGAGYALYGRSMAGPELEAPASSLVPAGPQLPAGASCDPGASVLSPAAYLLDLLAFLSEVFGQSLNALDGRFLQNWADLLLDPSSAGNAAEDRLMQGRIAVEVLERFVAGRTGWTRDHIYQEMSTLACTPVPAGLVSWWPGDANANDLVGQNNGTPVSGVTCAAGKVGQALQFDGLAQNVVVPDAPSLNPTSAITLEAWVCVTGNQGGHRDILSKDGEVADRQYLLSVSAANRFRAHVGVPAGFLFFDGATPVQLNTWYHVAMAYDGAALTLYVNGSADGSIPATGPIIRTTEPLRIGGGAPPGAAQYFFQGLVDEAALYDRALSAADIQAIYAAGGAGKCKVASSPLPGAPPAQADVLEHKFDAYLAELGTDRTEIWDALQQGTDAVEALAARLKLGADDVRRLALQPSGIGIAQVEALLKLFLVRLFDAYLVELGTSRVEIAAAVSAGGQTLADLATRLHLSVAEVTRLNQDPGQLAIAQVEELLQLLRKAMMGRADRETSDRLEAAISRIEGQFLGGIRDNLIRLALQAAPVYRTTQALEQHLHIDLSSDPTQVTTRIAQAIETIQAAVRASRLGSPEGWLPGPDWDDRWWSWLESYGTWHAAQMVFYCPENFALPGLRRDQTPQFRSFLDAVEGVGASPAGVRRAVGDYGEQIASEAVERQVSFTATVDNRTFLFSAGASDAVYVTEQTAEGEWRGWTKLANLPGSHMVGAVGFNGRLYLFTVFTADQKGPPDLSYTWMDPDELHPVRPTGSGTSWLDPAHNGGPSDFAFVAGPDYLSVYHRVWSQASVSLHYAYMDPFHQWGGKSGISQDPRIGAGYDLRAVGHIGESDYLLLADASLLYLVRVDKPYGDDCRLGDWQQLVSSPSGYVGTVRAGQVVVAYSYWLEDENKWVEKIGQFTPGSSVTWVDVRGGAFGMLGLAVVENASMEYVFLLHGGLEYVAFTFDGSHVVELAAGVTLLYTTTITSKLLPHPVARSEALLEDYRRRQLQVYANTPSGHFARLILDEWYFFIPLAAARALNAAGSYQDAADWFHVVYYPYVPETSSASSHLSTPSPTGPGVGIPGEGALGTDGTFQPDIEAGPAPAAAEASASAGESVAMLGAIDASLAESPLGIDSPHEGDSVTDLRTLLTVSILADAGPHPVGWCARVQLKALPGAAPAQCTLPFSLITRPDGTTVYQGSIAVRAVPDGQGRLPGLQAGSNTIRTWAADATKIIGNASVTVTYTPDTSAPSVAITPLPGDPVSDLNTRLSATITEDHGLAGWCARVQPDATPATPQECNRSVDPDATSPYAVSTALADVPGLQLGANAIYVWAADLAGNVGGASTSVTYRDVDPPLVTIDAPADGAIVEDAGTLVRATITERFGVSGWCVREQLRPNPAATPADCTLPVSGSSPYHVQIALRDVPCFHHGANTIRVWASDSVGNVGTARIRVFHPSPRFIYAGFAMFGDADSDIRLTRAWQSDPLNPHAIARTRADAYLRHTLLAYIENLLDWADDLFTRDTSESINQARELYQLALTLLGYDALADNRCADQLQQVPETVAQGLSAAQDGETRTVAQLLANGQGPSAAVAAAEQGLIAGAGPMGALPPAASKGSAHIAPELAILVQTLNPNDFCVPPNPQLDVLRSRAEANLQKLRSGRNYAGMRRTLEVYAAPAAPLGAPAQPGQPRQDGLVEAASEPPPIYRYAYLLDRAKYFIQVAQQIEAAMLTADANEAAETYNLTKARQDQQLAEANVQLQALRLTEARDSTELAREQQKRVDFEHQHFVGLLQTGLIPYEKEALQGQEAAANLQFVLGGLQGLAALALLATPAAPAAIPLAAGAYASLFGGVGGRAGVAATRATYERRRLDWGYQIDLAFKDQAIAADQITLGQAREAIAAMEGRTAELSSEFTADLVSFLTRKFTSAALYRWMARTLRGIYRDHLNLAVAVARMAQQAVSFERQEPATFVRGQYWEAGRQGVAGAERLLDDLNRLDQFRFSTTLRKRELTKVIALASLDPIAFQQLREQGWMAFGTFLEDFDRDFPGHHHRLIKNVSLTFVALVPTGEGIHATLSNPGISRVMVGPPFVAPQAILRQPEAISTTAPNNGTGLFEVNLNDPMLLPFEGTGVETTWRLELPPAANRWDLNSLVDLFFTIRYTALEDSGYRQQVLDRLGADRDGWVTLEDKSYFSARSRFADAWYQFQNPVFLPDPAEYGTGPGQTPRPYSLRLELTAADFPPNEEVQVGMPRVIVAAAGSAPARVPARIPVELSFAPAGGGPSVTISTDLVNGHVILPASPPGPGDTLSGALSTLKPFGVWTLRFCNEEDPATYPEVFGAGRVTWDRAGKLGSGAAGETVWVDEALPGGATPAGSEPWKWITHDPIPFSGSSAHQSDLAVGTREHSFSGATATLAIASGDLLFAYVYPEPDHPPTEIMLQWHDGTSWEHRAYWGTNEINLGTDGTASRRYMGPLPEAGEWVRLQVPAGQVELEGKTLSGMAFTVHSGAVQDGQRKLSLDWLTDAMLVVQYRARTRYLR